MRIVLPELPEAVRRQKVLIVEDSAFQRELLCTLLDELGIGSVQQVADGTAALAILRGCPDSLPLVLLDLEMPGMNGIELLERMSEERILAQVLIISGREDALIMTVEAMLRAAGMPLLGSLAKPLSGQDLHHVLCEACGEPPVAAHNERAGDALCEAALASAIERGCIRPYYQPKVNLRSGRVSGYEVLARWIEPDGRIIYPGNFIPLATESGLLSKLTFSLIDQVLLTLPALGDEAVSMALNLDITLLADRHFADDLIHRVASAGALPSQWILEVTESALMSDPQVTLGSVGRLRLAGFGLSIDDYGTGFSTLRQLSRLPFTELKIDHAFIREAHQNRRSLAILYSAIEMGHKLGLPCVAEGIENKEDLSMVERLGCHLGQGYFFARPIPEEQLAAWHARHRRRASLAEWISE